MKDLERQENLQKLLPPVSDLNEDDGTLGSASQLRHTQVAQNQSVDDCLKFLQIKGPIPRQDNTMKKFSCLLWIQHLCNRLYQMFLPADKDLLCDITVPNTRTEIVLPYDLIVDIFSRLPAGCVVPCVRASKPLLKLTRTPSFVDMHLKRASPVIAFQYFEIDAAKGKKKHAREVSVNVTDEALQKVVSSKSITIDVTLRSDNNIRKPRLYGSYNGFLMFKDMHYDSVLFLWNPATHEQVSIIAPHDGYRVSGLFFHPTSKEYRALFVSVANDWTHYEYSMLSLKTKSSRLVARSKYHPSGIRPPTIVNENLHWMLNDRLYSGVTEEYSTCAHSIVLFNMKTEKVSSMGHPGLSCWRVDKRHILMKLMEKDGKLWFVNDMEVYGKIQMWMLEDYERRVWVKMHHIELPSSPFCRPLCKCKKHEYPEALHIFEDKVLIRVFYEELYLYSLRGGDENDDKRRVEKYLNKSGPVAAVAHVGTLLSLHTDKVLFLFGRKNLA